jgi:hypothetical protein
MRTSSAPGAVSPEGRSPITSTEQRRGSVPARRALLSSRTTRETIPRTLASRSGRTPGASLRMSSSIHAMSGMALMLVPPPSAPP